MKIATTNQQQREPEQESGIGRPHAVGMAIKTCSFLAALLAVMIGTPCDSRADIPLVYPVENTGTNCAAPPLPTLGNLPLIQPLPDPFCWASDPLNKNGTRSTNFVDWECRRAQIKAQIENYEIGTKPAVDIPTQVTASYAGGTTPGTSGTLTVHVTANGHTLTLTSAISIPSGATAPYPVVIGMNSPNGSLPAGSFSSRGIATLAYLHNQVTTYGSPQNTDPYYQLYGPALNINNTGQYSAWAWGVSRLIDGLSLVTNTLPMDLQHICVTGCSYAGKMALFSGAFDERIALTVAQESGGGGDTSWRYSHTEPSGSVELIDNTDYNWFANQMQQFSGNNVSYLPEDHHELMALCAPRALYCTANTDYTWLSNPSAFVCGQACARIYATLGIGDRFGFNVDGGHGHCSFPSDQTNDLNYFLDRFMKGNTNLSQTIRTAPSSYASVNYTNWTAWWGTTNPVFPVKPDTSLALSLPATATEGDGVLAGQGSIRVVQNVAGDLAVSLTSNNTNKVTVPATVTIPAGQSNAVFDLTIINNSLLDGDQAAIITASAFNRSTSFATITVHDNDTATLSVNLPASAYESAGTLTNAGSVSIGVVAAANFTVSLTSGDISRLIVPATTVISNGQTSAGFNLTFVNNNIVEGPQTVSVAAHVPNWTDGSSSMTILNNNLPDHFAWSTVPSPQLIGEPFAVTITAQDVANNTVNYQSPVTLSALLAGNAKGTNTILNSPSPEQSLNDGAEYVLGYSFTPTNNLRVTDVLSYFGDKVSIWAANGQLLASQNVASVPGTWVDTPLPASLLLPAGATYLLMVHENGADCFWSQNLPATFADGTINQSFWDYGDVFPSQTDGSAWYFVDLRYATDVVAVPVSPGATASFSSGIWSGNVAVLQAATNVTLLASAGAGHSGTSVPFNVLGTPKLAIAASGNSVVLSWPVAASGFVLEQASVLPNWSVPAVTPVVVGNRYTVTNTLDAAGIYYRLHKP